MISTPVRGEIVLVQLDPVTGSEQGGQRPALVISPDVINEHSPVVLVAELTSRKVDRVYPFEVLIEPPEGGLEHRSKVLLMQLRSVDRRRLVRSLGRVGPSTLARVNEAVRVSTGLVDL